MWGPSKKIAVYELGRVAWPDTNPAKALILVLPVSRTGRNKYLLCKPHRLQYFGYSSLKGLRQNPDMISNEAAKSKKENPAVSVARAGLGMTLACVSLELGPSSEFRKWSRVCPRLPQKCSLKYCLEWRKEYARNHLVPRMDNLFNKLIQTFIHCTIGFSAPVEMFHLRAVQYSSHESHVAGATGNWTVNIIYFDSILINFKSHTG